MKKDRKIKVFELVRIENEDEVLDFMTVQEYSNFKLCYAGLSQWFNSVNDAKKIWVTLSDKSSKHSYALKINGWQNVWVYHNKCWGIVGVYKSFHQVLGMYLEEFKTDILHFSIEVEVPA